MVFLLVIYLGRLASPQVVLLIFWSSIFDFYIKSWILSGIISREVVRKLIIFICVWMTS